MQVIRLYSRTTCIFCSFTMVLCFSNVWLTLLVGSGQICFDKWSVPHLPIAFTTLKLCKMTKNFTSAILNPEINNELNNFAPKLDAVVTYVNDMDPLFVRLLNESKWTQRKFIRYASTRNRFADNSDLKFLLRSIDKYGQLFRNIFIVVAFKSQLPEWLNLKHKRLKIVYHSDIWYNQTYLPVFNSLAIEANLHHIRDLSNLFVYFNDDLLLTQPVRMRNFVSLKDGQSPESIVMRPYMSLKKYDEPVSSKDGEAHWLNSGIIARNTAESVCDLEDIERAVGYNQFVQHSPHLLKRDVLYKAENITEVREVLETTWKSKFRNGAELNIVVFFMHFAQCYCKLNVTVGNSKELGYLSRGNLPLNTKKDREINNSIRRLNFGIEAGLIKYVCVNDNSLSPTRIAFNKTSDHYINEWRSELFPDRSSFEL